MNLPTKTREEKLQLRFERVLKDLYVLTKAARAGMKEKTSLTEKLAACEVEKQLREARSDLRLLIYDFEDAVKTETHVGPGLGGRGEA